MNKLEEILAKIKETRDQPLNLGKILKEITPSSKNLPPSDKLISSLEKAFSRGNIIEKGLEYLDFDYNDLVQLKTLSEANSDFNLAEKVAKVIREVDAHRADNDKQLNLFD